MKSFLIFSMAVILSFFAHARPKADDIKYYRDLTMNIRTDATFKAVMIGFEQQFSYHFELAQPIYPMPIVSEARLGLDQKKFYHAFWDRISLNDHSYINIGDQQVPLTCIFVQGQDNRFAGKENPKLPGILLKIYLVANDPLCIGPLNPNYPDDGGIREAWDTYFYYEIADLANMTPKAIKIRNHWNEFFADFVK